MSFPLYSRGLMGMFAGLLAGAISAASFAYGMAPLSGGEQAASFLMANFAMALFMFSTLPLFMVGLGTGPLSVLVAVVAGTVGLMLKTDMNMALYFAVINAVPALLLSWLTLWRKTGDDQKTYWYPEGYLLAIMAAYPCVLLLIKAYLSRTIEGGLMAQTVQLMQGAVQEAIKSSGQEIPDAFPQESVDAVIQYIARILPSMAGLSWVSIIVTTALLAQITLRQKGWNLRPSMGLVPMVVPQSLLLGVAASGLAAYFAPEPYAYLGANICIMLCVPYFFVGLAVAHVFARSRAKGGRALLVLFYIVLCGIPWLAILVTLLGTLDQGLSLQKRMLAASTKI